MKKILFSLMLLAFMAACNSGETKNDENIIAEVTIDEFEKVAPEYVGKQVSVVGIVDHVCKHGGKKILFVSDSSSVHVDSEVRFDEALIGEEITLTAIVEEFIVDEAYCQTLENEQTKKHSEGENSEEIIEGRRMQAQAYRDSMKNAGVDKLSFYSLKYVSHTVNKK